MKKIVILFLFILSFSFAWGKYIAKEGWYNTSALANGIIQEFPNRQIKIGTPIDTVNLPAQVNSYKQERAMASVVDDIIPVDIVNLAKSLDNDENKILDYVINNVKDEFYYGVKKGPLLTLLEKSGNDYDKIALVMSLLKAANKDDRFYIVKTLDLLPFADNVLPEGVLTLQDMMGLSAASLDYNSVANKLSETRIPFVGMTVSSEGVNIPSVIMIRHKIGIIENGKGRFIDLNAKAKSLLPIINVAESSGIVASDILTAVGGTLNIANGTVTTLKPENLETILKKYASNLAASVREDLGQPSSSLVGGVQFTKGKNAFILKDIDFGFEDFYGKTTEEIQNHFGSISISQSDGEKISTYAIFYKTIPASDYSKLHIYDGNSETPFATKKISDLNGERLWVYFDGDNGYLKLGDAQLLAKAGVQGVMSVRFKIEHAYDNFYNNSNYLNDCAKLESLSNLEETFRKGDAFVYNIVYGFSDANGLLSKRYKIYSEKLAAAKSVSGNFNKDGSFVITGNKLNLTQKDLLAEGLYIMGLTWLAETYRSDKIVSNSYGCYSQFVHRLGKVAQEESFYIDVKLQLESLLSATLNEADEMNAFRLSNFFLSAMEHGVIKQLQNVKDSVSTINVFYEANKLKNPLVLLTESSQVDTLKNYSDAEKQVLKDTFIPKESTSILIPQNRTCVPSAWDWKGFGYVVISENKVNMMISGGLNGGFAAYNSTYNAISSYSCFSSVPNFSALNKDFIDTSVDSCIPSFSYPKTYGADPVDMYSGAYTYEVQDVSAGETLSFKRIYNSNLNSENLSGLGNGWVHNYDIVATPRSAWEEVLGNGNAEQCSSFVAAVYAAKEVFALPSSNDAEKAKNWATTALITKWGVDNIFQNAVSIRIGKETMQFVKQYKNTGTATSPKYTNYYVPPSGTNYSLTTNSSNNYVLTAPYGDTMTFNSYKKIANIKNIFGRGISFSYNTTTKNLTSVKDYLDRAVSLTWTNGKISKVTCASKTASYTYTGDNLTSAIDPVSKVWSYEYDDKSRMTVLKNPVDGGSVVVRNVYSVNGSVKEQYSCGDDNKKWTFTYLGSRTEEKDPLGNIRKFYYDDRGFCIKTSDQKGNSNYYEYDAHGRETMRESPSISLSQSISEAGIITQNRIATRIENKYDNWHNKISETVYEVPYTIVLTPTSVENVYKYTENKGEKVKKAETIYDYEEPNGIEVPRLLKITQKAIKEGEVDRVKKIVTYHAKSSTKTLCPSEVLDEKGITSKYVYDGYGRMTSQVVGGRTTKYSTFSKDNPTLITYPDSTTLKLTYNTLGDVLTETNSAGLKTTYTYDNKRRRLTEKKTATGITASSTSITYDDAGNISTYTDEDGMVTTTVWNAQQKKLSETVGSGENAQTTTYGYDLADRLISTKLPDGKEITYTLDAAGNRISETFANQTTSYTYNEVNKIKTTKSHLGNKISYAYDSLGNKVSMTDAMGQTVSYAYNSFGEQTSLTNRRGGIFQMSNDLQERKTTIATPMGKVSATNYADGTWDIESTVSPSGNTTTMAYNATTGRLLSSTDSLGTKSYSYDKAGRINAITQGEETNSYVFNPLGQMTSSTSSDATVAYTYTPTGKIATITYPAVNEIPAKTVSYAYDSLGRLFTVIDWAGRITTYTYDNGNRLVRIDRPNGTYRELTYDSETGNLTSISEKASATETIFNYAYTYDGDNRITSISRTPKNRVFPRNSYDATYDLDNKLQTFRGLTISYDDDGNMISGPITESAANANLTYNARGELTSTGNVVYSYDAEGNRKIVMFYDKSILTQYKYIYNKSGEVNEVLMRLRLTSKELESTYYVYGAGLEYEVKIAPDGTEEIRYYHFDQVGSTIALTDQDKSITDRFSYDPWGYCIHSIGDSDTPFKYVGAFGIQTDPNGLVNMRARYYNPATKSFISADPSGFEGGLNWYLYASGDPFSRVDINGMWDGSIMSAGAEQMSTWGMSVAQTMMVNQSLSQEYWSTPTAQVARATIPFVDTYANYSMGNSVSPVSLAMDIASVIPIGRIAGVASKSIGSASAFAKTAIHGNSKLSMKAQHVYKIYDKQQLIVAKIGISGTQLNKNGTSPRAMRQVNKWNREAGYERCSAEIVKFIPAGPNARNDALKLENDLANFYRSLGNLDPNRHIRP